MSQLTTPIRIEELQTPTDWERAFPVVKELRENLNINQYLNLIAEARSSGSTFYRAWAAFEPGASTPIAYLGGRVLCDLVHGRHFYVDDLVVLSDFRARGIGAHLLKFAEQFAESNACRGLRLCTGVANASGVGFYTAEGWQQKAVVFKKGFA